MQIHQDQFLSRAMQVAANPVFIVDAGARIVWTNEAYVKMVGCSADQVMHKVPASLRAVSENKEFHRALWASVFAGETWVGELTELTVDGSERNVEAVFTPLKDNQGNPAYFLVLEHDITKRKKEQDRMWHIAHHDHLTGLPNRSLFKNLLELTLSTAKRSDQKAAILFIDLDKFKAANDTYGHHVGDLLLIEVGRHLKDSVRDSDVVARFGGDEFGAILANIDSPESAERIAQKIIEVLCIPMLLDGKTVQIGASIGIAMYPSDATDQQQLLQCADVGMYAAKDAGRNCFRTYSKLPKDEGVVASIP